MYMQERWQKRGGERGRGGDSVSHSFNKLEPQWRDVEV